MYQLHRRTPEGVWKTHAPMETKREAAKAAGMCIHDNHGTAKGPSQLFSKLLEKLPNGAVLEHKDSGYSFRIDEI